MARIYPDPISPETKSSAERELYRLFREQLDDGFVVMHGVPWIARDPGSGARDGEADFVLAHPVYGVLVVEVKGGKISLDQKTQAWTSTDRYGVAHAIKDPFHQARDSSYSLLRKLTDSRSPTRNCYWPVHYAVALPHVVVTTDLRPDAPGAIIIDQSRLANLQETVLAIYEYWHGQQSPPSSPGPAGIDSLIKLLAPSWQLRSRLSMAFEKEQEQIKTLTERQFMALNLLSRYRRVAIVGGAGTGKTMLAVEKTRRLAEQGLAVLFVCYNQNLARWLTEVMGKTEDILVTTFHGLCGKAIHWAGIPFPGGAHDQEFYDEKLPEALLQAIDQMEQRFDAVIVDEGQDFKKGEWWLALEALLKDEENGIFYVFFDDNQRIYSDLENIPIKGEPFVLDMNCRNTQAVHAALEPYSHSEYKTTCLGPPGRSLEILETENTTERDMLKRALLKLVKEDGVEPSDIVILTSRSKGNSQWSEGDQLAIFQLTWNLDNKHKQTIRVSTIHSFKGLESPVVILTELEKAKTDELVYVALSRARNHICVIGSLPPPVGDRPESSENEEIS